MRREALTQPHLEDVVPKGALDITEVSSELDPFLRNFFGGVKNDLFEDELKLEFKSLEKLEFEPTFGPGLEELVPYVGFGLMIDDNIE